ncbi:MAG: arsenite efflux transporter metallochaperone ArsD [Lachnospiraceae bacterium]|nr:arsenite efflux transporter metallochaperone ArsD [Lachnospiraceae bacterium]
MKTMKIFEPAMCCPTGLCGVGVDPELLRVSTVLNTLKENGIEVQRYNLTSAPMEFVNHTAVAEFLKKFGPEKLPVVMVDDFIVITGRYPTNEEFISWLELSPELLGTEACCEDSSCCCGDTDAEESSCCCGEDTAAEGCCEEASASDENSEGCCCSSGCC